MIVIIIALSAVCAQRQTIGSPISIQGMRPGLFRTDVGITPVANLTGRIAIVQPIFSDTAYRNAFYVFYSRYANSDNVTTDLNLLNVTLKYGWGYSDNLRAFLSSDKAKQQGLFIGDTVKVIDEVNVTLGGLFLGGKRAYDVVILGFTEYVTSEEYYAYKEFVATGGTLIIMDACNFLAQVRYYPPTQDKPAYLSLVKGHGWEFNGTCAWKSAYHRWYDENWNWVGSNYWHYWYGTHYDFLVANTSHPISTYLRSYYGQNITSRYGAHEENLLQNFTDTDIIGYWHLINPAEYPGQPIAAYQHRYVNGSVFHSGIMASDRVGDEEPLQAFLVGAVRLALTGKLGDWRFPPDTAIRIIMSFRDARGNEIRENGTLDRAAYCIVNLDNTSMNSGGVTYELSSVHLRIFEKTGEGIHAYRYYPTQTIDGTLIDASGLNWQIAMNTTSYPDGTYKFEAECDFIALVDNKAMISFLSAPAYYEISNVPALFTTISFIGLALISTALITYCIILLDRRVRR
jgi:hypothetical protein